MTFQATLVLFLWPVLRLWGETGAAVETPRGWIWRAFGVFFVASFATTNVVSWVLAPSLAPILAQPLFLGVIDGVWIALLWAYVRRRMPTADDLERRLIQRRTAWVFVVTLAITVLAAVFAEPWRGEGGCVFCGTVPSATVGVQFGAVSGVALLWQLRRRKADGAKPHLSG